MAVVEDRDNKTHSHTHSHDQNISSSTSSSITMSNNYTKDLFNKFIAVENHRRRCNIPLPTVKPVQRFDTEEMDEEDFELSLGLSMNGRFGFDPNTKKIKRTTSIPESMIPVTIGGGSSSGGSGGGSGGGGSGGSLMRTCSLPVENEEEWRKRKELQSQRRMEARKKRYEKQRNSRAMRERSFGGEGGVGSEGGSGNSNNNLVEVYVGGVGGESLIRTSSLTTRVGGLGLNGEKELDQVVPPSPQGGGGGSIGSSSGTSESEGQQLGQGATPMDTENSNKVAKPQNKTKDFKNLFEDMPSVTTKGEGPNGKKIEGFLYKYGKGEEVRILCVCHGSFLTPAEFVKHAGGGDVTNPLKHIVVNSSLI